MAEGHFYVLNTMFYLEVLMPNADKAAVDSMCHLVAGSTENQYSPFWKQYAATEQDS